MTGFAIQIDRIECYIGIPFTKARRKIEMETLEEELIADETAPAEEQEDPNAFMEAWPVMPDGPVKEFEEYLMFLGLRF